MRTIITLALVALALIPSRAAAQTSLTADRIYLGATGCALRTGSGTPTGGAACDFYLDIPTGHVWVNHAGTWVDVSTRTPVFTSISTPLVSTASGDLTLRPAADLVLDPLGRDVVPASNYFTNLGLPSKKFLALNAAELDVETLVAQGVISTIGGRVLVAPTTTLVADLTPAATTITVKHNQIVSGDVLFLEGNGQVEFLAVTSNAGGSAGAYTYSVTRNLDGSGADAWTAGDAVANFGTTGDGFIDINSGPALGNGGPSIIGYRRNSATFNDSSPRFVVGDLNNFYGHNTETYGFAAGNPSGAYIYADETNGLVLGGPSGVRAQITPAGAATFIGDGGGVTNINGGNIQTDTITAAQIAANAITTSELAANAVTAAKIQAGTITGDKIAAGTITAGALLVGPSGTALNDDPNVRDASAWQITNASIVDEGLFGPTGPYSWRNVGGAQGSAGGTRQIAIDAGRTYRIHGWGSGSGTANGAFYLGIVYTDASNATVDVFWCANAANPVGWTEYTCTVGAGSANPIPAGTRWGHVFTYLNFGGTVGYHETQDVRFEEMSPGTLIRDGAITTAKIQAGAITADRIAAGAVTAHEIAAATITGDRIAGATITGGNIAADSITSAHIAAGTIVASDIATGSITADRLNVTALSAITANLGSVNAGDITGVTIHGNTITGGSISGTTVSGSTVYGGSGNEVRIDTSGITVAGGDSNSNARLKLGSVELWGSNSGGTLATNGSLDAQAIRAHAAVDFEKTAHVYQDLTVDGIYYGGYWGNDLRMGSAGTPSIYWPNGTLPIANGGFQMYADGACRCLTRLASSERYKENIRPWKPTDPLALLSMPLYRFDFKADAVHPHPATNRVGLIVEQLFKVAPDAVVLDETGRPDGIQGDTLNAYLLAALKAVNDRGVLLEKQIADLQKKIAALEARKGK